jgi:hypothetical protein
MGQLRFVFYIVDSRPCFIVKDTNGQALAYVYYEQERG